MRGRFDSAIGGEGCKASCFVMEHTLEEMKRAQSWKDRGTVVFLSDFGTSDGAVSAMHGVADQVCHGLRLEDLTHDIPQFDIWEASYRLIQALTYWAAGTVFVSVVDPGVGSERDSVVVLTKSGHIIVTPDNGTLSHIEKKIGILEVRQISEVANRLKDSQRSYTFHGRDVYAYTGARLAGGIVSFDEVGPVLARNPVLLNVSDPVAESGVIKGTIDVLDTRYGSLWTNIPDTLFFDCGFKYGDAAEVVISFKGRVVYGYELKICRNFAETGKGEALVYINSLLCVSVAINQGSFAQEYRIGTGGDWTIEFKKKQHNLP